jgi:hypothetical protein
MEWLALFRRCEARSASDSAEENGEAREDASAGSSWAIDLLHFVGWERRWRP